MIREGKKAEFICCKQGRTLAPTAAYTKRPLFGTVQNGEEQIRTVKKAAVVMANPKENKKSVCLQEVPVDQSSVKNASVQQAAMVTSLQNGTPTQHIVCKNISCSNVRNDITIKKLFHI